MLKQFSRYQAEQESYLAQKKTMTGIQAYKCFYETFDQLEENRSNQMELLKPKYQEPFASDTKRMLDEKRKILSWLLKEVPDLDDIVYGRSQVSDYRANTLQYYEICKRIYATHEELDKLIKQVKKSENSSERTKLCSKLEKLMTKYSASCAEFIPLLKPDVAAKELAEFAASENYMRDVIRQHQQMADFGNQTSLVATPNASEKDPNETVINTSKSNPKSHFDNIEVSSAAGQSQRTSKATSRSARRREAEELELKNLKAKQEAEERLREREIQLQNERDKMELEREQQRQHQELERQHQELEMRQRERELESERKKVEADEERRQLELAQKRGSSRASGSIANDVESNGSSKKQGYTKEWIQELPDPNYTPPALSPKIAVDLPKKTFPQVEKDKRLQTFFRFPEAVEQAAGEPRFPIVDVAGHQEVEKPKLALRTEQRKHSPEKTFQQQGPLKAILEKQGSEPEAPFSKSTSRES